MLRALLFDLDNTLVPEADGWNAAFEAAVSPAAAECGFDLTALRDAVFRASAQLWAAAPHARFCHDLGLGSPSCLSTACPGEEHPLPAIREALPALRRDAWLRGLASMGLDDIRLAEELSAHYMAEHARHHVAYDGVPALLSELSERYRLGVVTNGFADLQHYKLDATGLSPYFATVVISVETGCGKPDRRIFQRALHQLGVSREEALVIGDSLERDIAGAAAAGIGAVWLQNTTENPLPTDGFAKISSPSQLPELLASL